jgi:hypothetical protein
MKAFLRIRWLHASQAQKGAGEGPRREALTILINEIPRLRDSTFDGGVTQINAQ